MGHKSSKGTISIADYKGRIRLRWRHLDKRYSLSLSVYNQLNLIKAKKVALQIELDIITGNFDMTLVKYTGKTPSNTKNGIPKTFVELFEEWTISYKQMNCEVHTNYNSCRNMIKKWGIVNQNNILKKLNEETFCALTYNRRLNILKDFTKWLVKQKVWTVKPLEDVMRKKVTKIPKPKRKPFSMDEIKMVLDAFKNDTFCSKYSRYNHSHYYPFMYFLFKTGVRNAEAIGLRVSSVDTKLKYIYIREVMARTIKHTSSNHRVRKETKNGKERILPLTDDLYQVIKPLLANKQPDELVFTSYEGLAIDDDNFRKRVFQKILKELKIDDRVLYACRHTFGSRCMDQGLTPVQTAFLMGNNPETALRNYTHQINIPKDLPNI